MGEYEKKLKKKKRKKKRKKCNVPKCSKCSKISNEKGWPYIAVFIKRLFGYSIGLVYKYPYIIGTFGTLEQYIYIEHLYINTTPYLYIKL
jgi:hypothetical protein